MIMKTETIHKAFHTLFEEYAQQRVHDIAIVQNGNKSFADIITLSDKVAHYLSKNHKSPSSVAISLRNPFDRITAMLAAMKTCRPFVVVSPVSSPAYVGDIIHDSECGLLLSDQPLSIAIDTVNWNDLVRSQLPEHAFTIKNEQSEIACIVYHEPDTVAMFMDQQTLLNIVKHRTEEPVLNKANSPQDFQTYIDPLLKALLLTVSPSSKPLSADTGIFPLSSAQKRMYVLQQLDKDSVSYNLPMIVDIEGSLEYSRLKYAVSKLLERHGSLRTQFELIDNQLMQRVKAESEVLIDFQEGKEADLPERIRNFIRPFDLTRAPLFRTAVVRYDINKYLLMIDMHHIISDGVSCSILTREFAGLYSGVILPPVPFQYTEFARRQEEKSIEDKAIDENFWLKKLSGELPVLNIYSDFKRPLVRMHTGDRVRFRVNGPLREKLKDISRKHGSTLYMVMLAAYNILLFKHSSQGDIIVGTPIAGRTDPDTDGVVGMFVNTLAMRNHPGGKKTITDFIGEVRGVVLEAFEHQEYQFEELIDKLGIRRDPGRNPVFDTMVNYQQVTVSEHDELPSLSLRPYGFEDHGSKYDIDVTILDTFDGLDIEFEYATTIFKRSTIERMCAHLYKILQAIADETGQTIDEIDILDNHEKDLVLHVFNQTSRQYSPSTLTELFQAQVKRRPRSIALRMNERSMAYSELNQKANQLARLLVEKTSGFSQPVALLADRSFEMIVGIIGVLKAGCSYVPLDPSYPVDRLQYMLNDSGCNLMLTHGAGIPSIEFKGETISLNSRVLQKKVKTNIAIATSATAHAYTIYTSGSTGKPKGVVVTQRTVVNLIDYLLERYQIDDRERILLFSSMSFDQSVEQIFLALLSGSQLVLISRAVLLNMRQFELYLSKQGITHLDAVPNFLALIDPGGKYNLRRVISGGDVCPPELVEKWVSRVRFFNEYGPTETTVTSLISEMGAAEQSTVTIGRPVANTYLYILDNSSLCGIGIPGELCIGGECLALGYRNDPGLTERKFVDNPFRPGELMYRTGDVAVWREDGTVDFIGRADNQVKIRGFRVEPGEIESVIVKFPSVTAAVVIAVARPDGNKQLSAFFVASSDVDHGKMKAYLLSSLPDYMVPQSIRQVDRFPVNGSGKIDRLSLAAMSDIEQSSVGIVTPRNSTDEVLVGIWSKVLGIPPLSITSSFFDLGGHSLKAVVVVEEIRKQLNFDLPMLEIFRIPTILQISDFIRSSEITPPSAGKLQLLTHGKDVSKNLIFIHDGSGDVQSYIGISRTIDNAFNCWGIRCSSLDDVAPKNFTIEFLAEEYLKYILDKFPSGTVHLCGWSTGGLIALEITRQLVAKGKNTGKCILIDTELAPPEQKRITSFTIRSELKLIADVFGIKRQYKNISKAWQTAVKVSSQKSTVVDQVWEFLPVHVQKSIGDKNGTTLHTLISFANTSRSLERAVLKYDPQIDFKYEIITYFGGTHSVASKLCKKRFGNKISMKMIEGTHYSMIENSSTNGLTKEINIILKS
jgi:amino acid adenylation domain-containing protein